jgi:hypothetical protein
MKKYRPLIVGCGNQGTGANQKLQRGKVINFAHALKLHKGFDKICFVDNDNKKSIEAMSRYGGWATTIRYACESLGANIAVVATPDDCHYDVLNKLLEYPLKLVIVEKPICTDLQQARDIVELYKIKETPLMVNYTRRFLPYYDELKTRKPIFGICNFNRGWIHSATHGIDFFNMLGLKDYKLIESKSESRVWTLAVTFESYGIWHEQRIGEQPVWPYYDKSHWHVVNNAFEFLEGRDVLNL